MKTINPTTFFPLPSVSNPKDVGKKKGTRVGHAQIAIGFNNRQVRFRGEDVYEPFLVIRRGLGSDKLHPQPADEVLLRTDVQRLEAELQKLQQALDERCASMYGYAPLRDAVQEHKKAIDSLRSAKAGAHAEAGLRLLHDKHDECEWRLDRFLERDPKTASLATERLRLRSEHRIAKQAHADAGNRALSNMQRATSLLHSELNPLLSHPGLRTRIEHGQLALHLLEEHPECDERGIPLASDSEGVAHPCEEQLIIPAVFVTDILGYNGFRATADERFFGYRNNAAGHVVIGEWKRPIGKPVGHAVILRPYEIETFEESLTYFVQKQEQGQNALEYQMECYPLPEAPAASE